MSPSTNLSRTISPSGCLLQTYVCVCVRARVCGYVGAGVSVLVVVKTPQQFSSVGVNDAHLLYFVPLLKSLTFQQGHSRPRNTTIGGK